MTNPVVPIRQDLNDQNEVLRLATAEQQAAPAILGMYAFACITWVAAASMAGWYGSSQSDLLMVPFAAMFGGLAQFIAGMWAFKTRDVVSTVFHALWGAFWLAFGLVGLVVMSHPTNAANTAPHFGWWLVVLAATTWMLCAATFKANPLMGWFMAMVALGATFGFIGDFVNGRFWSGLAGYCWLASAIIAWILGSKLLLRVCGVQIHMPHKSSAREIPIRHSPME